LDIANAGPDAAPSLTVTDRLPDGAALSAVDGAGWSCEVTGELGGDIVTCTHGELAAGAAAPLIVEVRAPDDDASLSNSALIEPRAFDPNQSNNVHEVTTEIAAGCQCRVGARRSVPWGWTVPGLAWLAWIRRRWRIDTL
jgi:MYXO-CTERM domain-containing protein